MFLNACERLLHPTKHMLSKFNLIEPPVKSTLAMIVNGDLSSTSKLGVENLDAIPSKEYGILSGPPVHARRWKPVRHSRFSININCFSFLRKTRTEKVWHIKPFHKSGRIQTFHETSSKTTSLERQKRFRLTITSIE